MKAIPDMPPEATTLKNCVIVALLAFAAVLAMILAFGASPLSAGSVYHVCLGLVWIASLPLTYWLFAWVRPDKSD